MLGHGVRVKSRQPSRSHCHGRETGTRRTGNGVGPVAVGAGGGDDMKQN
jgi:hypothetical protein